MIVPTAEWQVLGACNYACDYCIQSAPRRKGAPRPAQVEAALSALAGLPGAWELKCSGGEVFAFPPFLGRIVPFLVGRTPHAVSVLTNFSAPPGDLQQFVQTTRGRLRVFSASLHVRYAPLPAFVEKAAWFRDLLDPGVDFVVNQVVLPGREAEALVCRDALEARGIRWFAQLLKVGGGLAPYPDPAALERILGDRPANRVPSFLGRRCLAGSRYFTVDRDGVAWSCRAARRRGEGRLGSLFEGTLALADEGRPCPYDLCPCTVPAHRGMVEAA